MNKRTLTKMFVIIILVILFLTICMPKSFGITPNQITGENNDDDNIDLDFTEDVAELLTTCGIILAVAVMMVLGIKYMTGSLEEKAAYKKTMIPYLIGCFFIFSASVTAPKLIELFKGAEDAETMGNTAIGLIQVIGTFVAVGVLMGLGVKYMFGSLEEKAEYKKSMLPYLIGSVMLFGAVNLTSVLYGIMGEADTAGVSDAKNFVKNHNYVEIEAEYKRANTLLIEAQKWRR